MRVRLKPGQQHKLLTQICIKNKLSLKRLSDELNVGYSAIKKYNNEGSLFPKRVFDDIFEKYDLNKSEFNPIEVLPDYWGAQKGGEKGIRTLFRKYPEKLMSWRLKGLRKTHRIAQKEIVLPEPSENLCEFLGAVLGDGTITKYFIRISGDYRCDLEYFAHLNNLAKSLFGVEGAVEKERQRNTAYLRFSSVKLCEFVSKTLHMRFGKKTKISMPNFMKSKEFKIALLRGLMDTDGSLCKRGNKLALVFTAYNKYILDFAEKAGMELNIFTHKNESQVGTDSWPKICKYFEIVGSSNPRHIVCFLAKQKANRLIYKAETENFKNLYSGVKPYRARGLVVRTRSR